MVGSRPVEGCGARNLSIAKVCQYRPGQGRCWDLAASCQNSSKPLMTGELAALKRQPVFSGIPGHDGVTVNSAIRGRLH
jgi:hypothetical protein